MSRLISFLVLIAIVVIIGILFYRVMINFAVPLFMATLFVVIFNPAHRWILQKCKGRRYVAAAFSMAAILLIVLAPALLVVGLATIEAVAVIGQVDAATVNRQMAGLRGRLGLDMPFSEDLRRIESTLDSLAEGRQVGEVADDEQRKIENLLDRVNRVERAMERPDEFDRSDFDPAADIQRLRNAVHRLAGAEPGSVVYDETLAAARREFQDFKEELLGGLIRARLKQLANPSEEELGQWGTEMFRDVQDGLVAVTGVTTVFFARFVVGFIVLIVALYFFLADGRQMVVTATQLVPLDDRYIQELLDEFVQVSRAVVLATLLSATVQSVLAGAGFWMAGMNTVFLLMLITFVFAIVPVVGAIFVWLPVCLYLFFYEERLLAAVLLAIYGSLLISQADNVIRPWVLHGQSRLHPLLALLSILGGIQALGPIGILVGPMIVVFLQTSLKILHRELTSLERPDNAAETPET